MSGENSFVMVLEMETPRGAWCRDVHASHPDTKVRIASCFPRGDGSFMEVVSLTGPGWEAALHRVLGDATLEPEIVERSQEGAVVRLIVRECAFPKAVRESGALPRFPFEVKDGRDRWLLISTRERAQTFLGALRQLGNGVKVLYAGRRRDNGGLTSRQREILGSAVNAGYYEFPRKVSLSDMADRLGVSKSSLSETLMLIEKKVVAKYLEGT